MKRLSLTVILLLLATSCFAGFGMQIIDGVVVAYSAPAGPEISEDFADCSDWTNITQTLSCSGGVAHGTAWENVTAAYHQTAASSVDHYVQAEIDYGVSNVYDSAGVIARCDGTYYYYLYIENGVAKIGRTDSEGGASAVGTYNGSYAAGAYTVKLEVIGSGASITLRGYVTDMNTPVITTTDSESTRRTAGDYVGVRIDRGSGNGDQTVDNLAAGAAE